MNLKKVREWKVVSNLAWNPFFNFFFKSRICFVFSIFFVYFIEIESEEQLNMQNNLLP